MKQILTTIVLLSLIATTAQAVPVAMQRSGTFTTGTDVPSNWNIMLFFDSDDIQDDELDSTEVTDFMITTSQGILNQPANYEPDDTIFIDDWSILFISGSPNSDNSELIILDDATNQTIEYSPFFLDLIEESLIPGFRLGNVSDKDITSDDAGWWTFKPLTDPAVPEPVTTTLLLAGTLAMTRRRRVA